MTEIIMVIDGHDWRYTGDGWRWLAATEPGYSGTWDDLRRKPYDRKICMTCGFDGLPNALVRPCHEIWAERNTVDVMPAL